MGLRAEIGKRCDFRDLRCYIYGLKGDVVTRSHSDILAKSKEGFINNKDVLKIINGNRILKYHTLFNSPELFKPERAIIPDP